MDEQLKRRLMGATIIVALVVIFVPMLFEDHSDLPAGNGAGAIPALPEGIEERTIELPKSAADVAPVEKSESKKAAETGYRIVPLDDPPPKQAKSEQVPVESSAAPVEGAEAPVEEDSTAEGEEAPAAKPEIKAPATAAKNSSKAAAAKPKETPAQKPKSRAESGRPESGAKKPAEDVAAEPDEMPPQAAEEPEYPAEEPFKPKAVAAPVKAPEPPAKKIGKARPADTAAAKSVASRTPGQKSVSAPKPLPPESASTAPAAPATEGAGAPSGWMVQAGSFTTEGNARALADKLRKQSLPASVHVFQGDSGPVYRVTVGPELNRARAEQIQKQIENAAGTKGIILPHQ